MNRNVSRRKDVNGSVYERIAAVYPTLSGALKQFADHVVSSPVEVAGKSIQLAVQDVGVSVASANRLARALGYEGYSEFRGELIRGFKKAYEPVERLRDRRGHAASSVEIFAASLTQDIRNLEATREHLSSAHCDRAVEMILGAERRLVLGFHHASQLAALLAINLDLRCGNTRSISNSDGSIGVAAQLFRYTPADMVIAIAFPRYYRETIELCRLAKGKGIPILAITDGPRSPLASLAQVALYTKADSMIAPTSDASALAMIEALSAAVAHRAPNALQNYEQFTDFALPWFDLALSEPSANERVEKRTTKR